MYTDSEPNRCFCTWDTTFGRRRSVAMGLSSFVLRLMVARPQSAVEGNFARKVDAVVFFSKDQSRLRRRHRKVLGNRIR